MLAFRISILALVVAAILAMVSGGCGFFAHNCKNLDLIAYEGDLNFDYAELFAETRDCIKSSGLRIPREIDRDLPELRCVAAVSCSDLTDNNCILRGVAGRYCVKIDTIAIPCRYNELQGDWDAARRLVRHEMIHHLGYEIDYDHSEPIWDICD